MTIIHRPTRHFHILRATITLLCAVVMLLCAPAIRAHDPAKYAASSVLADGKWGKVKVSTTGMQFVSAATLRQLGFSDPMQVNVYGFGGRLQEDNLRESDPDDLPILPSVKSSAGVWFFGHNHIRWTRSGSSTDMPYTHDMQPYAEESWYFISDRAATAPTPPAAEAPASATDEVTTYTRMLLHEQDLIHPSTTGRIYLGEDFRATPTRRFTFDLTDKADDQFKYKVAVGNRANAIATLTVTPPQGDPLSISLKELANDAGDFDSNYLRHVTGVKSGSCSAEQLSLELTYNCSGTSRFANLDYIEVAYTASLTMRDSQLYFPLYLRRSARISIANAQSGLRVWDVTDPVRPREAAVTINGTTASFLAPAGNHEFVAFLPAQGGYSTTDPTQVENQDIHSLNTPDMLIISPFEYLTAANTLAAFHAENDGLTVQILTPEKIYNEFSSGTPDVGAFRRLLKMWYDRGGAPAPDNGKPTGRIGYCLIMSRPTYDNKMKMEITRSAGYPRVPIWQSPNGSTPDSSYPCDDYITMLEDSDTSFDLRSQKLCVAVGRMPVRSASEAAAMVQKYIDYVTSTDLGAWRNEFLVVADDKGDDGGYYHISQSEDMVKRLTATTTGRRFHYEKLYLDSYAPTVGQNGNTYPEAKEKLLRLWNDGVAHINYIGHASTVEWTHEKLLEWTDIQAFSNRRLPFLYAATCDFARYDQDNLSGAEVLWNNPEGGVIAMICPSRSVLIMNNGDLTREYGRVMFDDSTPGQGRRIGDIMIDGKNRVTDDNRLRYVILGDPAMRYRLPANSIEVTAIDETEDIADLDPDDYPVLPARGRAQVKGVVRRSDGSVNTDFNGLIDLTLYDGAKAYTSNPRPNGETVNYDNHGSLLYRGMTKVTAGEWSTTLIIPADVEQLYTNALLSCYAYSEGGDDAHGSFSDFYIFGYDDSAPEDNEGPQIHYFALNREDFEDGGLVHTSPVVMAKISDESGINLSSLGIGHQITLTLDERTYFDDVNTYYTPDTEDFTAGTILYPLPVLEAGEHSLRLTVWDNANNSASADISFNVAAAKRPEIYDLYTDVNPARDHVTFTLSTDRPMASVECTVEVFDLNGRRVWTSQRTASTDMLASISVSWDLCTSQGVRVPRGIYLYRATVTSPDGTSATRSRKLAVTAQ